MSVPPIRRRLATLGVAVLATVGLSLMEGAPASASGYGYVRLAHLSPDTPNVDVYLSSVSGAIKQQVFKGVGYGIMSDYLTLPAGTYAVAMRGSGAPPTSKPVLSTTVVVASRHAYTVAGVGTHAELGLKVFNDDLRVPGSAKSKIRIIQASIKSPLLNISFDGGAIIANAVPFAATTAYTVVEPGQWTLKVQPAGGGTATTLAAEVRAGYVYTLLVLDGANGLTAQLKTDAAEGAELTGGVATGGGGTAPMSAVPVIVGGSLILLIGVVAVGWRLRHGRRI